jgi:hypothetical protein
MFGKKLVAAPPAPRPIPVATKPGPMVFEAAPSGYLETAKTLGLVNRGVIISFLQREEIPCYDLDRVTDYMNSIVDPVPADNVTADGRLIWRWFPLRQSDLDDTGRWLDQFWLNGSLARRSLYPKPVPLFALRRAQTICEEFPAIRLVVADRDTIHRRHVLGGDPFLAAVVFGDFNPVPFAVWDEPGF